MTATTTTIDGNLNHCKMHVQSDAIDQSEGGNLAVTCHQKCCEEKHLEAKIDHYRKVAKLADKYHILCRYSPNYESYPQNIRWRLAFMVMDFHPWLGLVCMFGSSTAFCPAWWSTPLHSNTVRQSSYFCFGEWT